MSTETWQPAPKHIAPIDPSVLKLWSAQCQNAEQLVSEPDYAALSYCMKQNQDYWFSCAEALNNDELWQLMQFFTLAEEADTAWAAGDQSPVIHLNKLRKSRDEKLQKEQLQWIREHSSNRFLPNGPIVL